MCGVAARIESSGDLVLTRLGRLLGCFLLTAVSLTWQPAPASASVTDTVNQRYSSHRYVWVEQFNLCLSVYVTSTLRATYKRSAVSQGVVKTLKSPRIVDPDMQVTFRKSCDDNSEYKRRHRVNTFGYHNFYYGHTCSYDPSFNVGFPWSVGVGITPDCGDERVARYGITETGVRGDRGYRFNLVTEGQAFSWGQSDSATSPGGVKICTSVSGFFRIRDTQGDQRLTLLKKVRLADACISR